MLIPQQRQALFVEILPKDLTLNRFFNLDFEIKFKCRESLVEEENILDEYIVSNYKKNGMFYVLIKDIIHQKQ